MPQKEWQFIICSMKQWGLLHPKTLRPLVSVYYGGFLVVLVLFLAGGCRSKAGCSFKGSLPPAGDSALSLGPTHTLVVPEPKGGDDCDAVIDANGTLWVFLAQSAGLSCMAMRQDSQTASYRLTGADWKSINRMKATVDATGKPLVIFSGFDGGTGEALAALGWSGENWSMVEVLDRLLPTQSIGNIDAMTDTSGILHVVYDRPLKPYESYAVGFIIVDGQFPDKCFHVMLNGQQWSKPEPTTGRGRYYVDNLKLSHGSAGQVCLSAAIDPIDNSNCHVGCQTWSDGTWHELTEFEPRGNEIRESTMLADMWCNRHLWWRDGANQQWMYRRIGDNGTVEQAGSLWLTVLGNPPPINYYWEPLFDQTPDGIPTVWSAGHLTMWNGNDWVKPVAVGQADALNASHTERICVCHWSDTTLVVQEVLVVKLPSNPPAERP